jgi:hypothetical protein
MRSLRHVRHLALVLVALLVTGTLAVCAPAAGGSERRTPPLRVMLVGDSMTQGIPGSATYRYWLWREFRRQGVPVRFVGPRTDLATHDPAAEHAYELLDHGFERQLRHAALGGSGFRYHLPLIGDEVTTYRPDVVVLQLGFNDTWNHTPERIAADTQQLLDRTWAVDPAIRFVVGEIPPSAKPGRSQRERDDVAAAANALVAATYAAEPRVAIAHHVTGPGRRWQPETDTFDFIHPSALGETLFAKRFAEAFVALGVLAGPVPRFHQPAWTPALPIAARGEVGRAVVDLAEAWRTSRPYEAKVLVRDARGSVVARTRWSRARSVTVRLAPGRYAVAPVVRRRNAMVSQPGDPVPVTVR